MPTTALTGTTTPGRWSTTGAELTMAAADVANGNHVDSTKNVLVFAHNTHASTTYTVTVTSAAESQTGRTGDVSAQNVAAGEIRVIALTANGWNDANGQYLVSSNNASVELGWIQA